MVGALAGAIVVTATYVTLPNDVEAVEQDIVDLKQIIQSQQIINDFYYQREQTYQPKYQEPQRRCWDFAKDGYEYEYDCITNEWL